MSLTKCLKCKYYTLSYVDEPCKTCIHNVDYDDNFRQDEYYV